ncbi:MAG: septum formation initiator family protein [Pseudomonadota bacterium]
MSRLDWKQALVPGIYILLAGIALVFVHSAVEGERGLRALNEAEAQKAALQRELAVAQAERAEVANRVRRLGEAYLDLDLLDERARAVLGLARPGEVLIRQ